MTLGDLIALLHEYYMDLYDDEDVATMATATHINEIMLQRPPHERSAA